jgi:manganese transport protein
MQAGSVFGYKLLWAIVLGTVAIVVYMEMCGRIAVVGRQPVFEVVRKRLGDRLGLATLIASNLLNLITCAAELGGIAILLHLVTGLPGRVVLLLTAVVFALVMYFFRFQWIERTFGLGGLVMIVFAVAALSLHTDWGEMARGLVPTVSHPDRKSALLYAYFAIGIFSAMLMEYEVHFYSSGAIEEKWTVKDLGENVMVATLGSVFGALLTVALLGLGAMVFLPREIFPENLGTPMLAGALPFGKTALFLAVAGTFACLGGASIETALSGGYNICQFYKRPWGKNKKPSQVPLYTKSWMTMLTLATIIGVTGIDPLQLVNISIIFGMILLPLTYYPILRAASDRELMGKHVNSTWDRILGTVILVLILVAAVAAIPLMIATNFGKP